MTRGGAAEPKSPTARSLPEEMAQCPTRTRNPPLPTPPTLVRDPLRFRSYLRPGPGRSSSHDLVLFPPSFPLLPWLFFILSFMLRRGLGLLLFPRGQSGASFLFHPNRSGFIRWWYSGGRCRSSWQCLARGSVRKCKTIVSCSDSEHKEWRQEAAQLREKTPTHPKVQVDEGSRVDKWTP